VRCRDDDPLGADDQVHRAPLTPAADVPGTIEFRQVTVFGDLHGAEDRQVQPAVADHREGRGGVDEGGARDRCRCG
jgi:hypothetical protein